MRTAEVNENLIGCRVKGVYTGMQTTGVIVKIIGEPYYKGVKIQLDEPINWGGEQYKTYASTARKSDEFGNLQSTELI